MGDYLDPDTGEKVGCEICYVHEKAFEKLRELQTDSLDREELTPLCPRCGKPMVHGTEYGYEWAVVSEQNSVVPNGNIGLYDLWHCANDGCEPDSNQKNYAMMPVRIAWNANHDIHYTGGRAFAEDEDIKRLIKSIYEQIKSPIQQYVDRKLHPEDVMDKMLDEWNVLLWTERDVEHVVCNWLYEMGYKK